MVGWAGDDGGDWEIYAHNRGLVRVNTAIAESVQFLRTIDPMLEALTGWSRSRSV